MTGNGKIAEMMRDLMPSAVKEQANFDREKERGKSALGDPKHDLAAGLQKTMLEMGEEFEKQFLKGATGGFADELKAMLGRALSGSTEDLKAIYEGLSDETASKVEYNRPSAERARTKQEHAAKEKKRHEDREFDDAVREMDAEIRRIEKEEDKKDKQKIAQWKATRPGLEIGSERFLVDQAAFGTYLTPEERQAREVVGGPANPRRMKNVKPEEQMRRLLGIGPGMSLDQAQKNLEELEFKRLKAQGVHDDEARDEAKKLATHQRGALEKRAFDNMMDPSRMELPRGIGQMSSEAYIDSVQTAREGPFKEMNEWLQRIAEAELVAMEWFKRNRDPFGLAP